MTTSSLTVRGVLLHDGHREAGSSDDGKRSYSWAAGYVVTVLPYGSRKGSDVQKYLVRPDLEATIETLLANVEWGTLISLELEKNQIVSISIFDDRLPL